MTMQIHYFLYNNGSSHYGKTTDCRALNFVLCAFHRAHGKHRLCRAFSGWRTANNNARYPYTLPCVFRGAHGNHKSLSCVFLGTHGNSSALTFVRPSPSQTELTGCGSWRVDPFAVRLRTTHGKDNKFAVRFRMTHGKVSALPCVLLWHTTMYF
jgi:hypothetical protein